MTTSGPGTGPGQPPTDQPPTGAARSLARAVSAALCLIQALVLAGIAAFYVVELIAGGGDDATRVVVSTVFILVVALGLGVLARLWWEGSTWARAPTVVWNLLLVPVAYSLFQSGQSIVGALVGLAALASLAAAAAGGGRREPEPQPGKGSDPAS